MYKIILPAILINQAYLPSHILNKCLRRGTQFIGFNHFLKICTDLFRRKVILLLLISNRTELPEIILKFPAVQPRCKLPGQSLRRIMLLRHRLIGLFVKQVPLSRNIMVSLISQQQNSQEQRISQKVHPLPPVKTKPVTFQILNKILLNHRIHNTLIQLSNHLHCLLLTEWLQIIHSKPAQPPEIHSRS